MRHRRIRVLASSLAPIFILTLALAGSAVRAQSGSAPTYYEKTTIPIPPWNSLENISVDISWVDPASHTMVIGDRTGNAVEVIDTNSYSFVRAAGQGQFAGRLATADGGPNGVAQVSLTEMFLPEGPRRGIRPDHASAPGRLLSKSRLLTIQTPRPFGPNLSRNAPTRNCCGLLFDHPPS